MKIMVVDETETVKNISQKTGWLWLYKGHGEKEFHPIAPDYGLSKRYIHLRISRYVSVDVTQ
jgi:hypothetical protein